MREVISIHIGQAGELGRQEATVAAAQKRMSRALGTATDAGGLGSDPRSYRTLFDTIAS